MSINTYADYDFYKNSYLHGREAKISESDFDYWSFLVSSEMRQHTFGRLDSLAEIPDEVRMCCCEISEKRYTFENAKDESGMILQSFGNDGQTGTYKTDGMSEADVIQETYKIMHRWLGMTGLLYCGVE